MLCKIEAFRKMLFQFVLMETILEEEDGSIIIYYYYYYFLLLQYFFCPKLTMCSLFLVLIWNLCPYYFFLFLKISLCSEICIYWDDEKSDASDAWNVLYILKRRKYSFYLLNLKFVFDFYKCDIVCCLNFQMRY